MYQSALGRLVHNRLRYLTCKIILGFPYRKSDVRNLADRITGPVVAVVLAENLVSLRSDGASSLRADKLIKPNAAVLDLAANI